MKTTHRSHRLQPSALQLFSLSALFFLATPAHATPLDTRGIPVDAGGVIHLDYDLFAKSALNAAMKKPAGQVLNDKQQTRVNDLLKQTGINPGADIHAITIAAFNNPTTNEGSRNLIIVIRGKFTPAKITDYAKQLKYPVTTRGAMTVISDPPDSERVINTDDDAPAPAAVDEDTTRGIIGLLVQCLDTMAGMGYSGANLHCHAAILNDTTLVIAGAPELLDKAAASLAGDAYTPPATFTTFLRKESAPMLTGCLGKLNPFTPSLTTSAYTQSYQFVMTENDARLRIRTRSEHANASEATQTEKMTDSKPAYWKMLSTRPEYAARAMRAKKDQLLLNALEMTLSDTTITGTYFFSPEDIIALLKLMGDVEREQDAEREAMWK